MAGYIGKSQGVVLTDIDNNSVATADIQDGAVTDAKITGVSSSKLSGALPALDGSALTGIDSLPSQTGQSGNYLTTDGTNASWGAVDLSSYATTTALNTAVANSSNWDTAYSWGDHSTQNYATTTGDTMTGALNFGDSVKAQFGTSNDLQIYHDGLNSYIQDLGTGSLKISAADNIQFKNSADTENLAVFRQNGACELYYDNSKKLATTSTGVSITGDLSVSGSISGAGKVLQVATYNKNDRVRAYINPTNVLPSSTAGAQFTSFTFTPQSANSTLILQSSTFHVIQESNVNDVMWCAAFYDTTSIGNCNPYTSYRAWDNAYDTTFVAFNHAFPSWGTSQKTIVIRFGVYSGGSNFPEWICCNYAASTSYDVLPTAYHDVGFSIIEVAP